MNTSSTFTCSEIRQHLLVHRKSLLRWLNRFCSHSFASASPASGYSLRPHIPPASSDLPAERLHAEFCLSADLPALSDSLSAFSPEVHPVCPHGCCDSVRRLRLDFGRVLASDRYDQWRILRDSLRDQILVLLLT